MDTMFNYLKSVPMLTGLPRETLLDLAGAASEEIFADGDVLVWENTVGDVLFIITAGLVDVVRGYKTPNPEIIVTRGPGEIVGEMSLVENQPRSATVVAKGSIQVISIPFNAFRRTVWGNVTAMQQMVLTLGQKLRQAQEREFHNLLRQHEEFARLQNAFLSVMITGLMPSAQEVKAITLETLRQDLKVEFDKLEQLQKRVKTLLDYVTLIQQQQAMSIELVNFAAIAKTVVADKRSQAGEAGVNLAVDISAESLWVPGDRRRLIEAMTYLLNRGIKQKSPGQCVVKVWRDQDFAYYEVGDQGESISPERLEGLWDSFTQISDALRGGEGLSLDMALTRHIAKAHGGETWANSSGQGNKFGFKVPKVQPEEIS